MVPNPDDETSSMLCMAFGNPELLVYLKTPGLDLFIDATFDCIPKPFYQCLIIMVYDHMWNAYVPVMYILMTRKCEPLYWEAFNQVVVESCWKLKICTYTTDFERGLMNQAAVQSLYCHRGQEERLYEMGFLRVLVGLHVDCHAARAIRCEWLRIFIAQRVIVDTRIKTIGVEEMISII